MSFAPTSSEMTAMQKLIQEFRLELEGVQAELKKIQEFSKFNYGVAINDKGQLMALERKAYFLDEVAKETGNDVRELKETAEKQLEFQSRTLNIIEKMQADIKQLQKETIYLDEVSDKTIKDVKSVEKWNLLDRVRKLETVSEGVGELQSWRKNVDKWADGLKDDIVTIKKAAHFHTSDYDDAPVEVKQCECYGGRHSPEDCRCQATEGNCQGCDANLSKGQLWCNCGERKITPAKSNCYLDELGVVHKWHKCLKTYTTAPLTQDGWEARSDIRCACGQHELEAKNAKYMSEDWMIHSVKECVKDKNADKYDKALQDARIIARTSHLGGLRMNREYNPEDWDPSIHGAAQDHSVYATREPTYDIRISDWTVKHSYCTPHQPCCSARGLKRELTGCKDSDLFKNKKCTCHEGRP